MAIPVILKALFVGIGAVATAVKGKIAAAAGTAIVRVGAGGLLKVAWGWLAKLSIGKLLIAAGGFVFAQLLQWVFSSGGIQGILNFNWNQSDSQIDAQIQSAQVALASQAGETFGNALGWITCGAVPGAKIFVLNQPLGVEILRNVGEEGLDEFVGNVRGLTQLAFQSLFGGVLMQTYKNNRAFFRNIRDGIGSVILAPIGGADAWKRYVTEAEKNGRAVTFAEGIEETTELLPDARLRAFVEEAYEGFFDGCYEAGYVVANTIESYFARQRANKGKTITVEIQPNRSNPREKYLIQGTEQDLIDKLPALMHDYQLFDGKDIGTVLALPPEERIRQKPQARMINVVMKSVKSPPWKAVTNNERYRETTIEIPDVRRNVTWQQVKTACGGVNGFTYGAWRCYVTLKNYRTFSCPGATEAIAEEQARKFATLSEHDVLFVENKHEPKEDIRQTNQNIYKETQQVYPAHFAIIAHERILGGTSGRPTTVGNLRKQKYLIDLWLDEEPEGTDAMINELFGNQDLNP